MEEVPSWQKKYVNAFTSDPNHGDLSCTLCHGSGITAGEDGDMHEGAAASGDFIANPAVDPVKSCGQSDDCHVSIAENFKYSLHFAVYGEKNAIAAREGVSTFEECPQAIQDGHASECSACHASCGDCHISRPQSVGGGLVSGHRFNRTPSQTENCQACHGSRIAVDFEGHTLTDTTNLVYDNEPNYETKPDVHASIAHNAGFTNECLMCHQEEEMHHGIAEADRNTVNRYNYSEAPTCMKCHDPLPDNLFHTQHAKTKTAGTELQCQICHSQPYDNCDGCHVGNEWQTDPVYQARNPYYGFKIAKNPLKDVNGRTEDYVLVRHVPVSEDTYANWGVNSIAAYDQVPTWKYATPHNIVKNTPQTAACAANCHASSTANQQLFLTTSFLQEYFPNEVTANSSIVMDGKFWGVLK